MKFKKAIKTILENTQQRYEDDVMWRISSEDSIKKALISHTNSLYKGSFEVLTRKRLVEIMQDLVDIVGLLPDIYYDGKPLPKDWRELPKDVIAGFLYQCAVGGVSYNVKYALIDVLKDAPEEVLNHDFPSYKKVPHQGINGG